MVQLTEESVRVSILEALDRPYVCSVLLESETAAALRHWASTSCFVSGRLLNLPAVGASPAGAVKSIAHGLKSEMSGGKPKAAALAPLLAAIEHAKRAFLPGSIDAEEGEELARGNDVDSS